MGAALLIPNDEELAELKFHGVSAQQFQRFIAAYNGDPGHTAKVAGLRRVTVNKILNTVVGMKLIRKREDAICDVLIADRKEREIFLTKTMRDGRAPIKDRLRACEILGKMDGDFVERKEMSGEIRIISPIDRTPNQPQLEEKIIDVSSD